MATSRSGHDTSQIMGARIKASTARGQLSANKMHQPMNRIRNFIDRAWAAPAYLSFVSASLMALKFGNSLGVGVCSL